MKRILLIAAWCGAATASVGQSPSPTPPNEIETLRQQVEALTQTVQTLQKQMKAQQETIAKLTATPAASPSPSPVTAAETTAAASPGPSAAAAPLFPTEDQSVVMTSPQPTPIPGTLTAPGTAAVNQTFPTTDTSVVAAPETISSTGTGAALTAPMTIAGGGRTYMNLSFDGQFALAYSSDKDLDHLEVGDHDPQQRGFNARNLELALDGAVDPYFQGFANIVFKLDNDNETQVEVEEAFMQTTDLPWDLQLKGGQFFADFGRINPTHPHTWDFADDPLVHGLFLGPDGLRGVGAQISWTAPTSWYSQFILAVQNGRGGTGFSFRGQSLVAYHDSWPYFAHRFGFNISIFLEPKPGIPPSPSHLAEVITQMKAQHIKAILVEPYHNRKIAEKVAQSTGAKVVNFCQFPGGLPNTDSSYVELIDALVNNLVSALR